MIFSVVNTSSSLATSSFAPARSLIWAPVTTIDSSQPSTSTAACRPLPLIFFPPWNPRLPFPTVTGGLDDLGVDDHRRGLGGAALALAQPVRQRLGQPPGAPPLEELPHRLPGREVHRQRPPLHAVLDHVEHRVRHRPQVMLHRAPGRLDQPGHHRPGLRLQHLPLLVSGIGGIGTDTVMAPAPRCRASGVSAGDRVDRHTGLLALEGVDTSPTTRSPLASPDDTPGTT